MTTNQLAIEDELLEAYFNFKSGKIHDVAMTTKLLSYYKPHITNIDQLKRINISDDPLFQQLAASNQISQSLEELANLTKLKLILSKNNNNYPYVNILGKDELEVNFTGTFKRVPRRKALDHVTNLCKEAKTIFIYDKYLTNKNQQLLNQLFGLFPLKNYTLIYKEGQLDQTCLSAWKVINPKVNFRKDTRGQFNNFHDRYLVIDDQLEIILSSGFDNLISDDNDFTYVLRVLRQGPHL